MADDLDCGLRSHATRALVECANPHDSPGPYAPPTVSLFIEQDSVGVTALLDSGTILDVDLNDDGGVHFAVDGAPSTALEVIEIIDENLSVDERVAVSEALQPASISAATDQLVDILGE